MLNYQRILVVVFEGANISPPSYKLSTKPRGAAMRAGGKLRRISPSPVHLHRVMAQTSHGHGWT